MTFRFVLAATRLAGEAISFLATDCFGTIAPGNDLLSCHYKRPLQFTSIE